jgi:hypothetical protein
MRTADKDLLNIPNRVAVNLEINKLNKHYYNLYSELYDQQKQDGGSTQKDRELGPMGKRNHVQTARDLSTRTRRNDIRQTYREKHQRAQDHPRSQTSTTRSTSKSPEKTYTSTTE